MPYINMQSREKFMTVIDDLEVKIETAGELNYVITKLCENFLGRKGKRYQYINEIIGVLECSKQEFYRRVASPYENEKIEENGDVFIIQHL